MKKKRIYSLILTIFLTVAIVLPLFPELREVKAEEKSYFDFSYFTPTFSSKGQLTRYSSGGSYKFLFQPDYWYIEDEIFSTFGFLAFNNPDNLSLYFYAIEHYPYLFAYPTSPTALERIQTDYSSHELYPVFDMPKNNLEQWYYLFYSEDYILNNTMFVMPFAVRFSGNFTGFSSLTISYFHKDDGFYQGFTFEDYIVYSFFDSNGNYLEFYIATDVESIRPMILDIVQNPRTYYFNQPTQQDVYWNGYNAGQDSGYTYGYDYGYSTGYNEASAPYVEGGSGYNGIKQIGYNEGVSAAENNNFLTLLDAVFYAPLKAFTSLFDFELLGFNMLGFVKAIITLVVILTVVGLVI